jgi:hypothetical protein
MKEWVNEAKLFWDLLRTDKKKRSVHKNEDKILVLAWVVRYMLAFISHNLHKFWNINKTFLQEFSFFL